MDLAARLGTFVGQACPGKLERLELGFYGDLREFDSKLFVAATVDDLLHSRQAETESVTIVNAVSRAKEMGLEIVEATSSAAVGFANLLGAQGVNIARMGLGRKPGSGRAVMLIGVDGAVPAAALAELPKLPGVREARSWRLG